MSALGLSAEFSKQLAAGVGDPVLQYLEDSVSDRAELTQYVIDRLAGFTSGGRALELTFPADRTVLDLGTTNPSTFTVAAVLSGGANPTLIARCSEVLKAPVTADEVAITFISTQHVQATGGDGGAAVDVVRVERLMVAHRGAGKDTLLVFDRAGVRQSTLPPRAPDAVPRWMGFFAENLPARDRLTLAYPGAVVGATTDGDLVRCPVQAVGSERVDAAARVGRVRGVTLQRMVADPATNAVLRVIEPLKPGQLQPASVSRRAQALNAGGSDSEIRIERSTPPTPDPAPSNVGYGNRKWGCGGRSSPDACMSCCDTKEGTAVAIGMGLGAAAGTTAVAIAAAGKGAALGAFFGPGGVALGAAAGLIGGAIGCFIAIKVMENCYSSCHSLYPLTAELAARAYTLEAVIRDGTGSPLGYRGHDDTGAAWVLSATEAVRVVRGSAWGGPEQSMEILVQGSTNRTVGGVRRGVPYLTTRPDAAEEDNVLHAVPDERSPLPAARGIGLS